jgi:hypothetical protein
MTPTADDVTVTVPHVWHACNPTDAHWLARPIEGHTRQNGTESQGRRNVVRKREGAKCVVSFQIFVDSVQNELAFGVVELHPGNLLGVAQHRFRDPLRRLLLNPRPQHAWKERVGKTQTREPQQKAPALLDECAGSLYCRWVFSLPSRYLRAGAEDNTIRFALA